MVRPPKPTDIKPNVSVSPTNIKSLKITNPELEDRYRTEMSPPKKIVSSKPKTSVQAKVKNKSPVLTQNTKPISPKSSKISKTQSQPQSSNIKNLSPIPQSKSHTAKPASPIVQKRIVKTKIPSTKKKTTELTKTVAMNPLMKITEADEPDSTSLPLGEQFISREQNAKTMSKIHKTGKSRTKKITKKSSTKNAPKEVTKILDYSLKQEESGASLTTHFRMAHIPKDLTPVNTTKNNPSVKRRRASTIQKKVSKSKPNQEDNTKETSNNRKSKLHKSTLIDRIQPSDSVPIFSVREIKHNDSFVISARKFENSSGERRHSSPECLKLHKRTSSVPGAKSNKQALKSCLKKTWQCEADYSHYPDEFLNIEGNSGVINPICNS